MPKEQKKAKNNSGFGNKAVLYTLALIALALAVIMVSSLFIPQMVRVREAPPDVEPSPEGIFAGIHDTGFALRILLSVVNIAIILYLLYVHVKDYLALRSNFTLGLVAFLFSFLLYALSTLPVLHVFLGRFGTGGMFSFIPLLFSAIGLLVFAKLSSE
jgi:hypothetical protein